jgi:transposase-like protein
MIYLWVDGLYLNVRLEDSRHCLLVVMGLTEGGEKRFLAIEDGFRESEQSWFEVLTKLKARGMSQAPELAIGDGALGFWKALSKLYPETKQQRCWVHKTKNVLDKVPKATQPKMKQALKDIYLAETKTQAEAALETLLKSYQAKYPQACECLSKDSLLSFYDFPAEHWRSIRTTNPIESVFATFSLRTDKTRGCLSRQTGLAMVYKLAMSAQKTMWSWPITLDKNHRDIKFCQEVKDVRENREKGL